MKYILILMLGMPNFATAASVTAPSEQPVPEAPIEQPVPEPDEAPKVAKVLKGNKTGKAKKTTKTKIAEPPAVPPAETAATVESDLPKLSRRKARWTFIPRGLFWQEDIEAKELGEKASFHSQLMGISVGMSRTWPMASRRWLPYYGGEIAFGTVKSAGSSVGHIDSFKNQPWYYVGGNVGVAFRHSNNSEIRAIVPLGMRMIQWKSSRSTLKMGQESSFTTGLGVVSATKLGGGSSYMLAGFTHLYQWNATLWHAGFEYLF